MCIYLPIVILRMASDRVLNDQRKNNAEWMYGLTILGRAREYLITGKLKGQSSVEDLMERLEYGVVL